MSVKTTEKSYLKVHFETIHEGKKPFKCDSCESSFSYPSALRLHISKVHGSVPLKENLALKNVKADHNEIYATSMLNYKNLLGQSSSDLDRECDFIRIHGVCKNFDTKGGRSSGKFKSEEKREKSNKIERNGENEKFLLCYCSLLICVVCHRRFNSTRCMTQHMKTNHKWSTKSIQRLKFQCSECKLQFWMKDGLKKHITKMHKIQEFKCSTCEAVLKSKLCLKSHIEYVHEGKERKKVYCEICDRDFSHKSDLDVHIASVHEGKKDKLCPTCGYTTACSNTLKRHIETLHEDTTVTICHLCGKTLKCEKTMRAHFARVHEKKKPYQCEICEKMFFDRGHLKIHNDKHFDIRPHKCYKCDKKFKRKNHMKTHLEMIHGLTFKNFTDMKEKLRKAKLTNSERLQ